MYKKILDIGVSTQFSDSKNKRIRLLNIYSVIWIHFAVLFPLLDFISGIFRCTTFFAHIITIAFLILVIYLNKKRSFIYARLLWLFIAFVNFSAFSLIIIPGTYMEYYFVILSGISLSLYKKNRIPLFVTVLSFFSYLTPYFFVKVYPDGYAERIEIPAMLGVFLSIYFLVNYFKKLNQENEEKLSEAYQKLEETQKSELAHLQLKSLKAQMNPHFMFNAMNSIQNLVLKGDKHEAYQYLSKFSGMIRENLEMSEKSFVSFEEELSLLKKYLALEKLRFKDSFEYSINGIDTIGALKIPSMIVQPFVENAIKHGLLHKVEGTKKLEIEFIQTDVFECVITDNGVGIKQSLEINKQNEVAHVSFSTKAIKERLQLLKDYYQLDIGFSYLPCKEGTKVRLKIPYTFE